MELIVLTTEPKDNGESNGSFQLERQHGSLKALVSAKSQQAKQPNNIWTEFS